MNFNAGVRRRIRVRHPSGTAIERIYKDGTMVVIDCPNCKRRMTVVVSECPGCGKALERRKTGWTKRPIIVDVVLFLGGAIATFWFLWWLITGPSF